MKARFLWRVGVGVLTVVAVACGDDDEDESYGEQLRRDFVSDCTDSGTDRPVCTCLYDALEAEVPFDRFQELDQALRDGTTTEVPESIQEMVISCAVEVEDS